MTFLVGKVIFFENKHLKIYRKGGEEYAGLDLRKMRIQGGCPVPAENVSEVQRTEGAV